MQKSGTEIYYIKKEYNSNYIFALSDGMGSGKEAKEESRFTLKILKSILKYSKKRF